MKQANLYHNREISWLSFNARVLQEAEDSQVPLLERIKFLGIFSSNLDEFFRVRVATLKRAIKLGASARKILGDDPKKILEELHRIVLQQTQKFETIYQKILRELEEQKIFIINEKQLGPQQEEFVQHYFHHKVQPNLVPIMLDYVKQFDYLKDQSIYLATYLLQSQKPDRPKHALIEIPTDVLSRFVVLPSLDGNTYIILLDDVIRYSLPQIFAIFDFDYFAAYTIKMTRDAELDIENDALESYIEKISKSVKNRKKGRPVRFTYDEQMPEDFLNFLTRKFHLTRNSNMIPGGRYHNFKDFMDFPKIGLPNLRYQTIEPLGHPQLNASKSLLDVIRQKDVVLHYPYHSFDYMTALLREGAIDPRVVSIKMTLYRLAKHSNVVNALIHAVKNGTIVTVVVELQARFDEEANIYWANKLEEEGARVIYGVPRYKVHAKLCLLTRRENGKLVHYANVSTGNYNEVTARIYCDTSLFTADPRITKEVAEIFNFFEDNIHSPKYRHLLVSPFHMRSRFLKLINNEIANARLGKPAYIILKVNSLVDREMLDKLCEAGQNGVKIKLIIRGACALVPGLTATTDNIEGISIIDKFLEHARIFIFGNGGAELYFISSADWMTRNLSHRIEVACPIYDQAIQRELKEIIDVQMRDSVKARMLNSSQDNAYRRAEAQALRSQVEIYHLLQHKLHPSVREQH